MSSQKNTTTGRALSMASMGADIAGSYVGYLLQRAFLGEAKGKIKLKSTHTRAARRMANEMQALRGPAMKLGQMLSLQTGVLPDEILAELATLQMEAPGMHPSLVRVQFKGSLGRELFKTDCFSRVRTSRIALRASTVIVSPQTTRLEAKASEQASLQIFGIRVSKRRDP